MRIDQTGFWGGGVAVLIWAVAGSTALAQETDWTAGVAVELAPDSDVSIGVDALARQGDIQRLDRALFSGKMLLRF